MNRKHSLKIDGEPEREKLAGISIATNFGTHACISETRK